MLTASILVAKVRESPHVPETHAESHLSQHILDFRVPRRPLVVVGRLGCIWALRGGQLSFGAALAKPGSVLKTVQRRLLILVTQNTPSSLQTSAQLLRLKPGHSFFPEVHHDGRKYLEIYVIRLIKKVGHTLPLGGHDPKWFNMSQTGGSP